MIAVLELLAWITLALLVSVAGVLLSPAWQRHRRRQLVVQDCIQAQARIDAITRATLAAMRAEARRHYRRS